MPETAYIDKLGNKQIIENIEINKRKLTLNNS